MSTRLRRPAVVVLAAAVALSVATAAAAYYAVTSTQANATFTAATLLNALSPSASVTDPMTVALSWTLPSGQLGGAAYTVTNTTDNHAVCTVTTSSCTDTAALPGTVNSYTIAATLPGTAWTTSSTSFASAATPDLLAVTNLSGPVTAGTAFSLKVTAQKWTAGALGTDTAYTGTKTLAWTGLASSPNGNAPAYPVTSVSFSSGASTTALTATAYAAGTATLSVSEGARRGSLSFAVAAAAGVLRYTSATPSCATGNITISGTGGTFVAKVSRDKDAYGNAAALTGTPTVTLTAAPSSKGSFSPASLTFASGAAETAASFTYTASGTNPSVVLTAASSGLASATCTAKQT